jgi:hypothetical protein
METQPQKLSTARLSGLCSMIRVEEYMQVQPVIKLAYCGIADVLTNRRNKKFFLTEA